MPMSIRSLLRLCCCLSIALWVAGCAWVAGHDRQAAPPSPVPEPEIAQPVAAGAMSYRREVQPILARRCVVCHACYDAPCQLKLTAAEGAARGASKDAIYGPLRLSEAKPTRLFEDAQGVDAWRALGFHSVLGARAADGAAAPEASVMARLLELKTRNPGPAAGSLPAARFDFDINRTLSCPATEEFASFAERHPEWGMPYALPEIGADEKATLLRWLAAGAPGEAPQPPDDIQRRDVDAWERFLNGDSLKARLMSRYIFEHLFLGHLHFGDDASHRFFRLVRSATPPGEPLRRIATRRPHDDPGVPRVWYRLVADEEVVVAKTHMPYRLDAARMARWRALFLDADYAVDALPGYTAREIANPFATFAAIPPANRYRFMLDEAAFTIMGFIKGPVCRGQIALNVINDRFWVFFTDPRNSDREPAVDQFLKDETEDLALPAGWTTSTPLALNWIAYSRREARYLEQRSRYLAKVFDGPLKLDLGLVWNGDGRNPNAALTVFRHLDSASVVQGLVGDAPKTAWVFTYPLLERVHYLLVANFDVFGTVGHQLESRLYMDFLRMEAEFNFLAYLPKNRREAIRDAWYRESTEQEKNFVYGKHAQLAHETAIRYRTKDPQKELYAMLRARVGEAVGGRLQLDEFGDAKIRRGLEELSRLKGRALSWLPENAILIIDTPTSGMQVASLMRNTGHLNVSQLFNEARRLAPDDDTLTVAPGIVGAYPNAIYRLRAAELPAFTRAIAGLRADADYRALADRYAVRRTSPEFWSVSDALHERYAALAPIDAGVLDYSRLENR